MENFFGTRSFNVKSLTDFSHLEKRVQDHLKKVYACLAMAMIVASAGAYANLAYLMMRSGFLFGLVGLGLIMALRFTPHSRDNVGKRVSLLLGFAFTTGIGLGPLISTVLRLDPSILVTSFLATSLIFVCFSLAALFTRSRSFLFLGGMLGSGLSLMLLIGLANIFMGSRMLFTAELYLGLVVMCGFVLFDTQLMVEKCRSGDDDFVWHCVELFLDFVGIFRRLMVILADKENNKNKRRN